MCEEDLIKLLKNNLRICSYIENNSIHTIAYYGDIELSHSQDGYYIEND